jgi:putative tricarboxylic transport membrane protein
VGTFLGVLPGGGALLSAFASYALEKKVAKKPERFGKGAIEGVAGPETANNATTSSAFIPMLTLGIPPNPVLALIMAALLIHGVQPGPLLIMKSPDIFWGVVTSMYIGNFLLLLINIFLIPAFVAILRLPYTIIMGFIVIFASVGAYSVNNNFFDVWMMLGFAVLGYLMRKLHYPIVPLVLGLVLGNYQKIPFVRPFLFPEEVFPSSSTCLTFPE